MAAKLKTVKITYGELENIVERKSENKPNSHQKDKINEKKRKTKRPEIGIYRPPSLLKQKNPVEDVDNGQQQLNEQGEIWEEEEHSTSSATNSKENSIEREINDGIKDLNVNEKHDLSKSRRKRPEIQRYVPKGKILEMQQNKNEDTESSGEVGDVTPLFIDEGSDTNDKKIDLKLDDIKNIKVTVSKDGESKQVSRSRSNTAEAQSVEDMPSASRSKSETQSTEKYQRQPSQRGQGDYRDYKGSKSDTRNRYSNVKKEGFSASPKPQRTDRRQGKFQPARNDNQRVPDEDLSDDGNVIQTMVFERKDENQSDSKLTVENLSQKPPRGSGKQGSKRYSTNMRRPRAGSFSSDVSTASDLSIDEETTERILSWDREVEMEMAKQVHNETQKLKEYLEKQEGSVEWGKEDKHMNWSEMVADMPIDDIQDIPPDWEHIKPAGSVELLDKISSSKENEDIGQRNYQNAGTFPRRNKRNSGDRYKGSSIEGRNENWNAGSWDRRWNHDNKNKQDNDDYYRGYDRRERRLSNGSTGHRRRRQSRESNGRRSRDSSVSSVQSVRSNHGDEDMYGSYRRHKRQNSNSSLRGGSSRERLNEPESLNIKVTIGSDRRQVVVPEGDGKQQGKNVGRGRGRGRRQHGLDMSQGQRVGSRGPSEEPESIDMQRKDQPNRGGHNKEESSRGRNVGRGRGGRSRSKESVDWNRDRQGNKEPSDWNRDRQGNKEHGDWNRDSRGSKEHGDWNRDRHGNKEHGDWNRDRHGNKEHGDLNRDRHGNREHGDWGRDRYHGDRRNDYHSNRESNSRRGDFHGNRDFGSRQGGRSRNNSEREKDNKSPQVEKISPQTHSGGLIKLPSNVHTTEEHKREEQSSRVEKEKETSQKSHNRDSVRDQRPSAGQKQLFDPKNPNKPIVIQESSNLKFQDTDSSNLKFQESGSPNLKFQESGSPNLKFQEPAGMESPSPPAYPQNPPFQGYGPQYYGPQFPDQGMYGPPGPPMPPQMMPPHGYFYGYPPPQYYEMIRGKQREIMFDKMLNECLGLDNQLGNLVARRLNGESLSLLANQRQELTKRYEHLILIDIDQSTKHNVDQLLWKAVFYQVIEVFRKHMNEEDDSKTRLSQILDEGTAFYEGLIQKLQKNYRFKLDDFLDTHNLPPENIHRFVKLALLSSQRNMICLGDIARYREQMNDSGKVNYGRARNWYTKAQLLAPKNGRPYNQLAILALYTRRKLDAVYYYMRSLAASNPFLTARESLMSLFDEARKKAEAAEKKRSDEKDKHKNPKQQHQQQQHKHGERIEIWIGTDGTSSEAHKQDGDGEDLEKMDAVERKNLLNKRFVLSFLNIHGKLFTKIGRESFPECCAQMLKEFRALLKYNAIGPSRLLQLMAINMFAIDNTALKDTSLASGFRSELQEQAVELGLYMFGILVERCSEQFRIHLKSSDYPTKLCNAELEELIPGVKIWTDWMICNSQYWNPPPATLDPSLGVQIDVWSATAGLCNILKDIDINHVKLYTERKEGCEPVLLMEDSMLSGFVPLLSAPIEISFVHKLVDKEIAQDCLRIQKLQLFGDYLCGIEPPMLAYNVETKQYYSIALSVEETEEQKKPSLSAEEWSDDGDVIIESEEEIIHGGDDDHVKHLKKKKLQLKQIKQDQEKHKENIQKIIDKNRHHCIEVEIHPIFLVPDTNCFIDHLPGLKKLILSKKFTITVPLVVINELDGLAKGSKDGQNSTQQHANRVRKTSEESVQFLEAEFEKKNSHLKTQTSKGNILETIAFRSEESENGTGNNDDIILSSCLHYCKDKAREFMPKEKDGPVRLYRDVVLLTDDRNLRLKAHTHNVPVKDVPSFLHWSKVT